MITRFIRANAAWLVALIALAILTAVFAGYADAQPTSAPALRFAVILPDGCAVLACGLAYRLSGDSTRLIELAACPGESNDVVCPPLIHRDGFEGAP